MDFQLISIDFPSFSADVSRFLPGFGSILRPRTARQAFRDLDLDKDGKVSRQELRFFVKRSAQGGKTKNYSSWRLLLQLILRGFHL